MEKVKETKGAQKDGRLEVFQEPRKVILLIENSSASRGFLRLTLMKALPQAVVREAEDGAQVLSEITATP